MKHEPLKSHKAPLLVVVSGGQDSLTCLHWARTQSDDVRALSFDYGQRHRVELDCAARACAKLGVPHEVIKLPIAQLAPNSSLTSNAIEVSSSTDARGLPTSFVPGRNLVMLTAAASYAAARGIYCIITGVCQTDEAGYPDCREQTIATLSDAIALGLGMELDDFTISTPLMSLTKAQTFHLAAELGVLDLVIEDSHTCYNGDRTLRHGWGYGCDACAACKLRAEGWRAFLKERKRC